MPHRGAAEKQEVEISGDKSCWDERIASFATCG
jgi:hypothetical protein